MPVFGPPNIENMKLKKNIKGLINTLNHRDLTVRKKAIQALGELSAVEAIPAIIGELEYSSKDDRAPAVQALTKIGKPAVEPLIEVLNGGNLDSAEGAAEALGLIGDKSALKHLIDALDHFIGYSFLESAPEAILRFGPDAIEPLISAFEAKETSHRFQIINILEQSGDKRAIQPFVNSICRGEDDDVSNALVSFGKEAIPPLISRLDQDDYPTLMRVLQVLVKFGKKAIQPLADVLENFDKKAIDEIADFLFFQTEKTGRQLENASLFLPALESKNKFFHEKIQHHYISNLLDHSSAREKALKELKRIGWTPQSGDEKICFALATKDLETAVSFQVKSVISMLTIYDRWSHSDFDAGILEAIKSMGNAAQEKLIAYIEKPGAVYNNADTAIKILGDVGDAKAIRVLVDHKAVDELEVVLAREITNASQEDLDTCANLSIKGIRYITRELHEGNSIDEREEYEIDCTRVNELAAQELARRERAQKLEEFGNAIPVLPLNGVVVFPSVSIPLTFADEISIKLIQDAWEGETRLIGLFLTKDAAAEKSNANNIHSIGTLAKLERVFQTGNLFRIVVTGIARIQIKTAVADTLPTSLQVHPIPEKIQNTSETKALMENVTELFKGIKTDMPVEIINTIISMKDPLCYTYNVANIVTYDENPKEMQNLLELNTAEEKLVILIDYIKRKKH